LFYKGLQPEMVKTERNANCKYQYCLDSPISTVCQVTGVLSTPIRLWGHNPSETAYGACSLQVIVSTLSAIHYIP